ncbi:16S rRNA (cytidine(1402)-2'-O)-methyltransferase [Thermovibrio ammonificans]|uniref:Ribosomal RNA small subunit methyltransferase I n=1 Tax=Thermovibrio ammonificans (strain DSM 15698 / JCM 12110 / HB-1) TaxID=648996 RepID=E8T4E3_THEA1|nr:16S rRNA (cytidine(1402)-2'-O)-methyltransferase [Thermovibrio ammonificans]ADU96278.1 Uroporphyrin-III C/tetrapyrrole (Corrin/Porphyrin) methyltransferase [Thermovibrio ammonificans HB-1]
MYSGKGVGRLYVVATPIGNLKDITLRALEVLKGCDFIACEDTRQTRKLLKHYGIEGKELLSYHEHNEEQAAKEIVERLKGGESCALVSDAGTPCISDPGYRVVKLAREEGIEVTPVPGPSAVTAALSASGLPTDRFLFVGFLPRKEGQLKEALKEAVELPYTVVAYESPHRLEKTLTLLSELYPDATVALFKEITKVNEAFLKGTPEELLKELRERGMVKGEFVLLFPPGRERVEEPEEVLRKLLESGMKLKEAAKEAARITGRPKGELYKLGLKLLGK